MVFLVKISKTLLLFKIFLLFLFLAIGEKIIGAKADKVEVRQRISFIKL